MTDREQVFFGRAGMAAIHAWHLGDAKHAGMTIDAPDGYVSRPVELGRDEVVGFATWLLDVAQDIKESNG